MNRVTGSAVAAGAMEAAIQLFELIPGAAIPIEGVRAYRERIEEQQREAFVRLLEERVAKLEHISEWYRSVDGEVFVKKVVATALNAEYADKIEYFANALVNGPRLGVDQARRLKFVEMIRQLSQPAIDVLVVALKFRPTSDDIDIGELAERLTWDPTQVDACVKELYSVGALSNVTRWDSSNGRSRKSSWFPDGVPAITSYTREFAKFITSL